MTEAVRGEQASPLGQAQEFAGASSYQVRDELVDLIDRDLLGPCDGEAEVLLPRSAAPGNGTWWDGSGRGTTRGPGRMRPGRRWRPRSQPAGTGNCPTC